MDTGTDGYQSVSSQIVPGKPYMAWWVSMGVDDSDSLDSLKNKGYRRSLPDICPLFLKHLFTPSEAVSDNNLSALRALREGQRREQMLVYTSGSWRRVASLNRWVLAHCFEVLKREAPLLWRFGKRLGHVLHIFRASMGSCSDRRDVIKT
ncbi:unnamed protein product [Leuciscus chuanchicus]